MPHVENPICQHLPQRPSGQCWCCPGRLVAPEPCPGEGGTIWHCPRDVGAVWLCRCCNAAGNASAKPSWRAAEGLLQPHPLQALLIKELIWTVLLCASFVFRAAPAGGDWSSVWGRQAGDSGVALGEGVWQQRLCSFQSLCSRSSFTVCRDSREGRKPQTTTTSRETSGSGRCQGRQRWEPSLACHSHGGLGRLIQRGFVLWSCSAGNLRDKRGTGPNSAKPSPGQADPEPVTGARAGLGERVLQGLSARAWGQLGWEGIWAGSWRRTGSGGAPGHGVTSCAEWGMSQCSCWSEWGGSSATTGLTGRDPVQQVGVASGLGWVQGPSPATLTCASSLSSTARWLSAPCPVSARTPWPKSPSVGSSGIS
ncbi:uncharacterized protein LOC125323148 isoform X2 [Corvus hawaiiensis]|uniref:uncharacterized protein LOC125323148 isoform X1 n=1 Tax=Corvus hawaiiensis TaxID=134902 RepID=UPI0020195C1B|nr:uncharacterized protein LOC125323148 isoform X1 [Corvus hawaiiensis]XP_048153780.1 uncharacterized protein LOC125323148 isoform X2 [Corvus hawaiiensis]